MTAWGASRQCSWETWMQVQAEAGKHPAYFQFQNHFGKPFREVIGGGSNPLESLELGS